MVKAIVTKSGNSYALRVPKRYITDNNLHLGDEVEIEEPLVKQQKALTALVNYGKTNGKVKKIPNPVEWQRESRTSDDPWDLKKNDIARQ